MLFRSLLVPGGPSAKPYLPDLPAPALPVMRAQKKAGKHVAARKGGATKAAAKSVKRPAKKAATGKPARKAAPPKKKN